MTGPPGDRSGPPVYVVAGYGPDEEVDLRVYLRVLVARRWLIAGFVVACTAVVAGAALLLPPVYEATAVVAPVREERSDGVSSLMSQFGGLASLAGIPAATEDDTAERIAILTSRAFTTRLVEENHLMPVLFADRWDAGRGEWRVSGADVPTAWDAYRAFEHIRSVEADRTTGLVTVSINWGDPEVAARWVQLHIDTLNRHLQTEAIREAEGSIAYLMEQVERTSNVELRQTLFSLVEAQTKKAMLARVRDDFAFKVIDPPVAPDRPTRPRKVLMVAVALILSTLVAVLAVFVLEAVGRLRRADEGAPAPPGGP